MSTQKSVKIIAKRMLFVFVMVLFLTAFSMSAIGCSVDHSEIDTEVELVEALNEAIGEHTGEEAAEIFVEEIKNDEDLLVAVQLAASNQYFFVLDQDTNQILLVKVSEDFSSYEVKYSQKEGYGSLSDSWYFAACSDAVVESLKGLGNANYVNVLAEAESQEPEDNTIELTNDNIYIVNSEDADKVLDFEDANVIAKSVLNQLPFQALKGKLTINGGNITATGKISGSTGVIGVGNENPTLVLNNTLVEASAESAAVFAPSTLNIYGNPQIEMNGANLTAGTGLVLQVQGEATLTDTTITAETLFSMSHGATVVVKSGKYVTTGLIVWLNNHADREALGLPMTSLQIEGGEFIFPENTRVFNFRTNGKDNIEAIITGGTFNGKAFNELTEKEWKALCTGDVYVEGALTDSIRITFPSKPVNTGITSAAELVEKVSKQGTQNLKVAKDLEFKGDQAAVVKEADANITIDLGGKKMLGTDLAALPFQVLKGKLTLNNGTIEAEGNVCEGRYGTGAIGVGNENPYLVLNNVTVKGSEDGSAVFAPSTDKIIGNPQIEMNGANLTAGTGLVLQVQGEATLTDTTITAETLFSMSHGATVVVKSGKYVTTGLIVWLNNHADREALGLPMTSLQIEGGEFIFPENTRVFNFRTNGKDNIEAVITGGTFNGKAFNELTVKEWKALCTGDVKVEGALTDSVRITFPSKPAGVTSAAELVEEVSKQGTQALTVANDLEFTGAQAAVVCEAAADITIDLGGNKMLGTDLAALPFQVLQGTLTINGGTIETEFVLEGYGAKVNVGVGNEDAKLVLNDVKVNGSSDSVAVFAPSTLDIFGNPVIEMNGTELTAGTGLLLQVQGEATLTDTTITAETLFSMSHGAKVVVKSGKYVTTGLIVWLNNHANRNELGFPMTSLQIEGGEFIFPENTRVFNFRTNGKDNIEAIITGGTFNGKAFNELTVKEWKALCTGDVKVEGALTEYVRITFPRK